MERKLEGRKLASSFAWDRCETSGRRKEGRVGEDAQRTHSSHMSVVSGLRGWDGWREEEEEWWKAGLFLILPGIAWRADAPLFLWETVHEKYTQNYELHLIHYF